MRSLKTIQVYTYLKKYELLRDHVVNFVPTIDNSWLAFLGPNKRKIVQRKESCIFSFPSVNMGIFKVKYRYCLQNYTSDI